MRRMTLTLALTVLALVCAGNEAFAALVGKEGSALVYRAAPGEDNTMEIDYYGGDPKSSAGERYVFTHGGETPLSFSTGAGCESGGTTVTCRANGVESVRVDTGDLGDLVTVGTLARLAGPNPIAVTGGSGNDSLEVIDSWRGRVTFDGGTGDDDLSGADLTRGGPGSDSLSSHEMGARLLGGGGNDTIRGDDAQPSEARLVLTGGAGDDRMWGGEGRDTLQGGRGADRLAGAGSADVLRGGAGNDRLSGDDGDDTLHGGDGRDRMRGFLGSDTFYARDRFKDFVDGGSTLEYRGVHRTRDSRNRARVDRRDTLRSIQERF